MSRSVLDLPTYHSAADQLLQANHYAAGGYGSLTRGLADGAAMAGDDATSEEFADAYDDAAREAVAAYADLVASFTTLGRLVARSADNHGRADVASALGSAEPFDPADPPSLLGGPVVVDLDEPPSSVGGESSAPALWDLVADQLEGWVWPDADVDRLRSIAGVWRQAAASLRVLPTYCDAAVGALGEQVSPEIPLAVEAVSDLAVSPELLALSCDQLADSCEGYADQVETHRDIVVGILEDLAVEIAVTIAASAALSFVSGGAAAAGGASLIATRVASAARRVVETLKKLQLLVKLKAVAALTNAVLRIGPVRAVVTRFAATRHLDEAAAIRRVDDVAELDAIVYGKAGGRLGLDEVPSWVGMPAKVRTRWDTKVKYKKDGELYPIEHIKNGHWPGTPGAKGKFHDGITEDQLFEYVEEAVRRGDYDKAAGKVEFTFDEVIGTNKSMASLSRTHPDLHPRRCAEHCIPGLKEDHMDATGDRGGAARQRRSSDSEQGS